MMEPPVEVGAMLAGKYRIERVIGQGGMGIVVAAMHDELDQRVAIKFLSSEGAKGSEWISRFSREAKAAAKIKNEHAVKVFDVGRLDTGIPYMVMEFLDGQNLDEILEQRGALPIDEASDYILQACEALAEAHLVGIVHRDLKPANLFLTHRSDGTTCVKILDFGISKVDESLAIGASVTHTTSLVGSPLYMSPERLRGAKDVDRRADIWSLGVLLQEMVTGATPFVADTIPEIHALVLTTTPTPLHRGCPHAPAELETLILKCLEKTADARFQNVLEFARALGAIAPGSQGSVDRIARITVGGSGPRARISSTGSGSFPPAPMSAPNPRLAVTTAVEELSDSGRISSRRVPPSRESLPTVSATGKLGDALKTSTGKVVAIVGLVVVAFIVIITTRAREHAHPAAAATTSRPVATAAIAPAQSNAAAATATATSEESSEPNIVAEPENSRNPKVRHARRARDGGVLAASASASASAAPAQPASQDGGLVIDYGGRN